jgi:hypothetical protein
VATLQALRRAAARTVSTLEVGTASSATAASVTITTHPFLSSRLSDWAKDRWIHRPERTLDADADRLCATHTTATGVLANDNPWSDTPTGEVIEVLGLLSGTDLNRLVNAALGYCFSVEEFSFVVADAAETRHNLTATAEWLLNGHHVYQVATLATTTDRDEVDPFVDGRMIYGKAETRAGAVWLQGPSFGTSSTVYVKCIRSHYSLCRASGGSFGDQEGLGNEDDEAPATLDQVRWAVEWLAMDELLAQEQNQSARQEYGQRRATALAKMDRATRRTGFAVPRRTLIAPANFAATAGGNW